MNKSLIVVAKKTKEVLHKMAAGLGTVYRLKETILAHAHSMISIKPACGDEATSIHIKKVGVIPGLETEYPSQMFLPLSHFELWHWIISSLICKLDLLKV